MTTSRAELAPARIMRWAAGQPEQLAVVDGREAITYGELAQRATHLAARLRQAGAGRDVPVALCLERSVDLVCASLAAMLAGGGYLVLDTDQPTGRLSALLADSGAPALVTNAANADRVHHQGVSVIDVGVASSTGPSRLPEPAPTDLCYVNYTSGSSGTPKGVAVHHDGLANLVLSYQSFYDVVPGDRMTQLARTSFDAYALEVWPCLANGATLYLCDDALTGSPPALRDWLVAQGITVCFVPTPLAEELLELSWPQETPLRVMLAGGDRLHCYPPDGLPFRLFNNYGPTEVTVVSTWCELQPGGPRDVAPPIGHPLPNLRAYVLDAARRPVTAGEPGELYMGGVGVARGYLGRPDLTAERFFADPFAPGGRMYATGDLVRERADGMLDFLGRVDEQIALHGFRIEPGEVETALRRQPGVRDAAVVLTDGSGRRQLVAFVVPEATSSTLDDVQEFAARHLPRYMVPSVIQPIGHLPLTPRGKVDRRELERQGNVVAQAIAAGQDEPGEPLTSTEKLLAGLWSEVLGVGTVRRTDSFFDLGGDSLLATRLARKAADHGLALGAADLLDYERLHELAAVVDRAGTVS
jgi:amino acid adenylation domain-containing protein